MDANRDRLSKAAEAKKGFEADRLEPLFNRAFALHCTCCTYALAARRDCAELVNDGLTLERV
jgi:hypothetical protein